MPGHDRTVVQQRHVVATWLVGLFVLTCPVVAQGPDSTDEAARLAATDPIDLAAERVWSWREGPDRWVILQGRTAVLQGVEGLRADLAVVRIQPGERSGSIVEVYAEGQVRFTSQPDRRKTGRLLLKTPNEVRLKPYDPSGMSKAESAPKAFEGLLKRGFDHAIVAVAARAPRPPAPRDNQVIATQFDEQTPGGMPPRGPVFPDIDPAPNSSITPRIDSLPSDIQPLPQPDDDKNPVADINVGDAPFNPNTFRVVRIYQRDGSPLASYETLATTEQGVEVIVIKGGVNVVTEDKKNGLIDASADSVVIWRGTNPKFNPPRIGPNGERIEDREQRLEMYFEGNVVFRQDERKVQGTGDQKVARANRVFFDAKADTFLALDAEIDIFTPGLIAPMRIDAPRISQYRPAIQRPGVDGKLDFGLQQLRADNSTTTGSRFPIPGYRFTSRDVDVNRVYGNQADPLTGRRVGDTRGDKAPLDLTWRIDARQNFFYIGPVPVFYWPRFVTDADDLDPPLRNIGFRTNNYFGQQIVSDWNPYKLFGINKPRPSDRFNVDTWNIDVDYLSARGLAAGTEVAWFGSRLFDSVPSQHFGYFDVWGLRDKGRDVLGGGPAIVTPPSFPAAGKLGYQRTSVPTYQNFRGTLELRQMISFTDHEEHPFDDLRVQGEVGYLSDRNFYEQYYKRRFETGLDKATLAYGIYQQGNSAVTLLTSANLQNFYTDSQFLPKLDYYRFGDAPLKIFTYSGQTGVDYANVHPAIEVNNPNIFAFLPYDPISNTSNVFRSGRAYTQHELDLPLNFDFFRVVPYVQGQAVGWTNQINNEPVGRYWGGAGARFDVMLHKAFPTVESELLNIHGLNHKVDFKADYRTTYSNVGLNRIGVQDQLDDNTYEFVRRQFVLSNYAGGLLPPQYDPRSLTLRRTVSPIAGTTDIQASIETLRLAVNQRLQTKRGPEGRRRIVDWMQLDVATTFFPNANRDNFGKSLGQTTYNYEWYLGDRTSFVSYGWFEFFDIGGQPLYKVNPSNRSDYFGIDVITTGVSINRPPRGNIFIGYTVINSGTINTSALNSQFSYQLSPKWYASFSNSYDFGNAILLGSTIGLTRIGADFFTTVGLSVDPQRHSYNFAFEITPRLSPNMRMGSTQGIARFDSRFAPTQ